MATMWLDRSPAMLLACCGRCTWREEAFNTTDGWRRLARHQYLCHADSDAGELATYNANRQRARDRNGHRSTAR